VVPAEELGPDYIIPSVFHPDVASGVAAAVRNAAVAEGAAELTRHCRLGCSGSGAGHPAGQANS
jgi:malic enzyme